MNMRNLTSDSYITLLNMDCFDVRCFKRFNGLFFETNSDEMYEPGLLLLPFTATCLMLFWLFLANKTCRRHSHSRLCFHYHHRIKSI